MCPLLHGRREELLRQSRHWIRQQDLEDRINEALDNPLLLYPGEEDEYEVVDPD